MARRPQLQGWQVRLSGESLQRQMASPPPGKVADAEWWWHQMTEGRDDPKARGVETGTWARHLKFYGALWSRVSVFDSVGG